MKVKAKGNPRRRLIWLLGAIVFLLGSYISLPYAQTAFVAWWEDDPLTPLCDVPNLRLLLDYYFSETHSSDIDGFPFYDLETGRRFVVGEGVARASGAIFSPNERYFLVYDFLDNALHLYEIETDRELLSVQSHGAGYWLPDNRLLYRPKQSDYWQDSELLIFNPEDQSEIEFSPGGQPFEILNLAYVDNYIHSPYGFGQVESSEEELVHDFYLLTAEEVHDSEGYAVEFASYNHDLERRVVQRLPIVLQQLEEWWGKESKSPNGRYLIYHITSPNPDVYGYWLYDLSDETAVPIRIIADEPYSYYRLSWSADSRYLVYASYQETGIHVFDAETGSQLADFEIPNMEILSVEWTDEGIWISAENLLQENPEIYQVPVADALYWGQFDGANFEMNLVMEASFGYPIYPLGNSDLMLASILESPEAQLLVDGIDAAPEWNHFVLINTAGEIVLTVDGLNDNYIQQTPDNRYISYRKTNNWIYLLELETYESCRVIESDVHAYTWLSIPQS